MECSSLSLHNAAENSCLIWAKKVASSLEVSSMVEYRVNEFQMCYRLSDNLVTARETAGCTTHRFFQGFRKKKYRAWRICV